MIGNTRYLIICDNMDRAIEENLVNTLKLSSPDVIKISLGAWAITSPFTSAQIYSKLGDFKDHIRLITHFDQCFPVDFDLHKFLNESH